MHAREPIDGSFLLTKRATPVAETKTYQRVGVKPGLVLVMLTIEGWQQTMPPDAWGAAAVGMWMAAWWPRRAPCR